MSLGDMKIKELFIEESDGSEENIEHSGVLGMKWGVRRYQNEDGTLTEEGKARYGKKSEYDSKSNSWKPKDARHLTDEELNRRNNRLNKEKQYRDLTEPAMKKATKAALKTIFVTAGITAAANLMQNKYYTDALKKGAEWLKSGGAKFLVTTAKYRFGKAKWLM